MNLSLIVGYVARKPKITNKTKGVMSTQFQLIVEPTEEQKKYTQSDKIYINCIAYKNIASYIWRNCNRGTLLSVEGFTTSKLDVNKTTVYNYVVVEKAEALTARKVILEDFEKFIGKYDNATVKKELANLRKQYKERSNELNIEHIESAANNLVYEDENNE